jgi:hypothetical protein
MVTPDFLLLLFLLILIRFAENVPSAKQKQSKERTERREGRG